MIGITPSIQPSLPVQPGVVPTSPGSPTGLAQTPSSLSAADPTENATTFSPSLMAEQMKEFYKFMQSDEAEEFFKSEAFQKGLESAEWKPEELEQYIQNVESLGLTREDVLKINLKVKNQMLNGGVSELLRGLEFEEFAQNAAFQELFSQIQPMLPLPEHGFEHRLLIAKQLLSKYYEHETRGILFGNLPEGNYDPEKTLLVMCLQHGNEFSVRSAKLSDEIKDRVLHNGAPAQLEELLKREGSKQNPTAWFKIHQWAIEDDQQDPTRFRCRTAYSNAILEGGEDYSNDFSFHGSQEVHLLKKSLSPSAKVHDPFKRSLAEELRLEISKEVAEQVLTLLGLSEEASLLINESSPATTLSSSDRSSSVSNATFEQNPIPVQPIAPSAPQIGFGARLKNWIGERLSTLWNWVRSFFIQL